MYVCVAFSSSSSSPSPQVVNGMQAVRHENGLPTKGDAAHYGDILHLANHDNATNGAREKCESLATEQILAFDSEEPFMKKASPIKPQHVAGTRRNTPDAFTLPAQIPVFFFFFFFAHPD